MAGDTSRASRELDQTPTWAVAGVCAIIIIISIALEKVLHKLGAWFTQKHKKALFEALDKVKAELMILGFISLILTFTQYYIAKICIPQHVADTMLPCPNRYKGRGDIGEGDNGDNEHRRRLLWFEGRSLAGAYKSSCRKGQVPIITVDGLHQLHILIFFLAVLHVIYSAATMALGRLKIRGWKTWEKETASHEYEFSTDNSRFRLTHETSFVRAHTSFWTRIPIFFVIGCFFRQFFSSVSRSDYLTLRNGFISAHLAPGNKFNFQKYIKRSLEDDFKVIVGVSPVLWASFVIFLLINVSGTRALFWASLVPLIIILAVGTKLQAILTKMALEITERHVVIQGIPLVQGSDEYFWFGRPQLVLHLIHFALFQNAFQITYFLWIWYEFGLTSCFHDDSRLLIVKLTIGIGALFLCSYIMLPLYALIAQMGSQMKKSIFDEQTSKALKNWRNAVKKKQGGIVSGRSPTRSMAGASPTASMVSPSVSPTVQSSASKFHRFKTTGHSTQSSYDEQDMSDMEADHPSPTESAAAKLIVRVDNSADDMVIEPIVPRPGGEPLNHDFSFEKQISLKK